MTAPLTRDDLTTILSKARRSAFTSEQTATIDLIAGALHRLPGQPLADDDVVPDAVTEDAVHSFVPAPTSPAHCAYPVTYRTPSAGRPHTVPCWHSRDDLVHGRGTLPPLVHDEDVAAARAAVLVMAGMWADRSMTAPSPMTVWADDHDLALVAAVRRYRRACGVREVPDGSTMPPD